MTVFGHSVDELIQIAYRYYPRGARLLTQEGGGAEKQAIEQRRLGDACRQAYTERGTFVSLLDRLQVGLPDAEICYELTHLAAGVGASYSADIVIPPKTDNHYLRLQVSVIAPCYVIAYHRAYRISGVTCPEFPPPPGTPPYEIEPTDTPMPHGLVWSEYSPFETSLDLIPDHESYARIIASEMESTFPGYQLLAPEIGKQVVPDVIADPGLCYKFPTLYDCLFATLL